MITFIGSTALRYRLAHKDSFREPVDIDLVMTIDELQTFIKSQKIKGCYPIRDGKKYIFKHNKTINEVEIAWEDSTARQLLNVVENDPETDCVSTPTYGVVHVPSIHVLYLLKMSHRYKKNSKHFLKTMEDIHLLRKLGAEIKHPELFKLREDEALNYNHPKLNVSAKEFFVPLGDVKYVYNHDSIHEAVKHLVQPAYKYFQKIGDEIKNDRKMFESLPEKVKLYSVLEEAYVLALERSQIPYRDGQILPKESFLIAMSKVCTNISSGWWREYAWENYYNVVALYNDDYVARFWNGVRLGIVKAAS